MRCNISLNTILLALIAFFATWGEGMQLVFSRASIIFPSFVSIYIILNARTLVKSLQSGVLVPKEFKYLFLFVFVHTLIYLLFNYQNIGIGLEDGVENDEGFAYGKSSNGTIIIRFYLFLVFSLLATKSLWKEKNLFTFSLFYILGFTCTILLGGAYHGYANALVRFSGGLQDPNAMALDALVSLMFSLYIYNISQNKKLKLVVALIILIEVVAILLSFSRGAFLALVIWGVYYLIHKGKKKNIRKLFLIVFIVLTVGSLSIRYLSIDTGIVQERFSLQEIKESKGANRGDIWKAYLSNWDKYVIEGMGFTNCSSAIENNRQGVREDYETHNQYLLFLVEYGFLGFLLYLCYWRSYLKILRKTHGAYFYLMSMGLLMMIDTFFLNIDKGRTFWIIFAVINGIWIKKIQFKDLCEDEKNPGLRTYK